MKNENKVLHDINNSLFEAIKKQDVKKVKELLLTKSLKIDAKDGKGLNALRHAYIANNQEILLHLLLKNAKVSSLVTEDLLTITMGGLGNRFEIKEPLEGRSQLDDIIFAATYMQIGAEAEIKTAQKAEAKIKDVKDRLTTSYYFSDEYFMKYVDNLRQNQSSDHLSEAQRKILFRKIKHTLFELVKKNESLKENCLYNIICAEHFVKTLLKNNKNRSTISSDSPLLAKDKKMKNKKNSSEWNNAEIHLKKAKTLDGKYFDSYIQNLNNNNLPFLDYKDRDKEIYSEIKKIIDIILEIKDEKFISGKEEISDFNFS